MLARCPYPCLCLPNQSTSPCSLSRWRWGAVGCHTHSWSSSSWTMRKSLVLLRQCSLSSSFEQARAPIFIVPSKAGKKSWARQWSANPFSEPALKPCMVRWLGAWRFWTQPVLNTSHMCATLCGWWRPRKSLMAAFQAVRAGLRCAGSNCTSWTTFKARLTINSISKPPKPETSLQSRIPVPLQTL